MDVSRLYTVMSSMSVQCLQWSRFNSG